MMSALLLIFCYLLGGLPIGLVIGKLARGIDIREFGSHNIGATNAWRTLGPVWGLIVFVLDVGKGLVPVLLAHHVSHIPHPLTTWLPVLAGLAAILGHNFSPFLRFKGGKGVATSLGVALGLSWQAALIGFAFWGIVLLLTRTISVASLLGTALATFLIWWFNQRQLPYGLFALLTFLSVLLKHRSNWERLRAGTEPKVGKQK